jgi:hypothetical protein
MYKDGESEVNIQSNIISYLPLEERAFFYSDTVLHPCAGSDLLTVHKFDEHKEASRRKNRNLTNFCKVTEHFLRND